MEGSIFGPVSPIDIATRRFARGTAAAPSARRSMRRAGLAAALASAGAIGLASVFAPGGATQLPAPSARAIAPVASGLELLPAAARDAVSSAFGANDSAYRVRAGTHGTLRARSSAMSATFTRAGAEINAGATHVRLALRRISVGRTGENVSPRSVRARGNEVDYAYDSMRAWYRNGPLGIEQGFVIARPPLGAHARNRAAGGHLMLSLGVSGNTSYSAARDGQSVTFTRAAAPALRLGSLHVTDANGRVLPSSFAAARGFVDLRVDASRARYPITIDPLIAPGTPLTGSGEAGPGELGLSVAISEDGTTALVGAPRDNNFAGAAWVFVRNGSSWAEQGPKLVAGGPTEQTGCSEEPILNGVEESECGFGTSVAISADGNTALIGSPRDSGLKGGAWVFTRSNGTWSRETQELTGPGEVGEGHFGKSVALSADGTVALVSAPNDNRGHGAVWSFKRVSGGWAMMGEGKLTPSDAVGGAYFGRGLAVSPDGTVALIGGPGDTGYSGAAWLFARSGSGWTQRDKVTGGEEAGAGRFGFAVALSEGTETALIGGPRDQANRGAAWMFTRSGDTLTPEGGKLTAAEEVGEGLFGRTLAISASGRIAIIGAPRDSNGYGAAFILTRSLSGATSEKFSAESRGQFGAAVAISADGNVPLFGQPLAERKAGLTWAGLPPALVTAVKPSSGPAAGGTSVTITGAGFTDVSGVYFGGVPAAYEVRSSSTIVAVSPAGGPGGVVDVTVATAHGTSAATAADRFTYVAAEGESPPGEGANGTPGAESPSSGNGEGSGTLSFNGTGSSGACRFALVSNKVRVLKRGRAAPRLRRVGSGRCSGRLTLTVRVRGKNGRSASRSLGSARFAISGSTPVTVSVSLNALGRSLLRVGHGQASASLVVVPTAPGPARSQTATVRLRLGR